MDRRFFIIISFLTILLSCKTKQDSPEIIGKWLLKHTEIEPLNIYSLDDDLPYQTMFDFKADSTVIVKSPTSKKAWTLDYKLVQDTVVTIFVDYEPFTMDSTSILFIGKKSFMPAYRIKKQSKDTLVLISRYRKNWLELPEANQFGTNPDWFKDYEIVLTRK